MITGKWEHLVQYKTLYKSLTRVFQEFTYETLNALSEKVELDQFILIPITSQSKEVEVPTLLEAHKNMLMFTSLLKAQISWGMLIY